MFCEKFNLSETLDYEGLIVFTNQSGKFSCVAKSCYCYPVMYSKIFVGGIFFKHGAEIH